MKANNTTTKEAIKEVLKANHGAQSKIAERLGIAPNTISMWFSGSPNRRLDELMPALAIRLAAGEAIEDVLAKLAA